MKRCNYGFLAIGTLLILALTACDVNIALGGIIVFSNGPNYPCNRKRFSYW